MHFLVDTDAVIPGIILIPDLGGHTALVQRTGGQATLPTLHHPVDHDGLAAVNFSLLRDWLTVFC